MLTLHFRIYEYVFADCEALDIDFQNTVVYTFGHKKLVELLAMVSDGQISVGNGRVVMHKIIEGDERMPSVIAEDLGMVGQVVLSDLVKSTVIEIINDSTDILDQCIEENDNRKIMSIVNKAMNKLNPRSRWDPAKRVGDPVVIQ